MKNSDILNSPLAKILTFRELNRVSPCFLLAYFSLLAVILGLAISFFRIFIAIGGFFLVVYTAVSIMWTNNNSG